MKKLPTKIAEKVYDVLMKFAEASPDYYQRESFIFHFGVIKNTSDSYNLTCMDSAPRKFICKKDGTMWVDGRNNERANSILRKISNELKNQFEIDEFTISHNAI